MGNKIDRILLDMIASGYATINQQDMEIEKLKEKNTILLQSCDTLYQNFKELHEKYQRLESAEIDDGK
jgi:FtsZ-binding cell division protein ZapB